MKGSAMAAATDRQIETGDYCVPGLRRGACPTLAAPMPTGDGLLVRLRPAGGALTVGQMRALAVSAAAHGNGILEITARGNLQVRGLRAESVEALAADIDAAGIIVPANPAIELSPLHGLDPAEVADPSAFEQMLRERLHEKLASPLLAPKLAILVDGRGHFCLDEMSADIRMVAVDDARWMVAIAGTAKTAHPLFCGDAGEAVAAVGRILDLLIAIGKHSRARELDDQALAAAFVQPLGPLSLSVSATPQPGTVMLSGQHAALGLRPQFGQMQSSELIAFLANLDASAEIRLAPDRQFLITGLSRAEAERLTMIAGGHGLSADPQDPAANIAACAGAGFCMSGFYETRRLAARIIEHAPELLDGSLTVHLSGCAKGCAHPSPALALVGSADGYGFSLDGKAGDAPDATIAGGGIESAIEKLAQLAGPQRQAGESAAACLKRFGAATIAKALRRD
ncbi:precorrin-3B synthase [Rhizobium sp. 21-4511-3d]